MSVVSTIGRVWTNKVIINKVLSPPSNSKNHDFMLNECQKCIKVHFNKLYY
jgi:hypothetical protein